jgi:hypothetical protein
MFEYTKAGPSILKVFTTRFGGWLFVYPWKFEELKSNLGQKIQKFKEKF